MKTKEAWLVRVVISASNLFLKFKTAIDVSSFDRSLEIFCAN